MAAKKRRYVRRLPVSRPSYATIERVSMAMIWQAMPSIEREYARNRARSLLEALEHIVPSSPSGSEASK